ncbi:MAG: PAS domain-containing protein [Minwuia sp.]|uniref:PAS domain-containing protein n=1 Tax=Minwuia sp. TaxID=2493630 RepID=UPI003A86A395
MAETPEIREESGFGAPPPYFDARIHQLYRYWDDKRGDRDIPDRKDLDPLIEIPKLLSAVWLLDVEHDPLRLRFRLIGNDLVRSGGPSQVGQYAEEQPQDEAGFATITAFKRCCTERIVFWRRGRPQLAHHNHISGLQNLALPLTVGGSEDVRLLLMMTIYDRPAS